MSAEASANNTARMPLPAWFQAHILSHPHRIRALKALALALLTLFIVMLRRPDQFLAPHIWVEDGTVNIRDFLEHGWASLWHPISGYFSVPIKFVFALSATLSFRWLPEISLVLALLLCYGVLCAIAFAPSRLRSPFVCAVAVLLIPTDAEAFGVSLYVGWWATLLVLLSLFWNDDGRRSGLRMTLTAIGGLSSPLVIGLAPLFVLRALVLRRRFEYQTTAVALATAALQWVSISRANIVPGPGMLNINMATVIEKFFGYYLDSSDRFVALGGTLYLGLALIAFLGLTWFLLRRELGFVFILLCLALGTTIAISISRVHIGDIHPIYGGPRYFFFPYILLSWTLIQLATLERQGLRLVVCMVLAMGLRNGLDAGSRRHGRLDWRGDVEQCLRSPSHSFRIHFAGDANKPWQIELRGEECAALVRRSWFANEVAP